MPSLILLNGPPQPPPASLLDAAASWLAASATLRGVLPGGVWADEAPAQDPTHADGTMQPYLVISEPSGDTGYESEGGTVETLTVRLQIYAPGKAQARAVRRRAVAVLRDAPLVFQDGYCMAFRDGTHSGLLDPDKGPGGCDVWQETVDFTAVVGR